MRYWFDEGNSTLFQLSEPPPDGKGISELTREEYEQYKKLVQDDGAKEADLRLLAEQEAENAEVGEKYRAHTAEPPPPPTVTVDMEKLARVRRKMDDAIDKLTLEFNAAKQLIVDDQIEIDAAISVAMHQMGVSKLTTSAGVIERKERKRVNVSDWPAFYRYMQENDMPELLEKRAHTTNCLKVAETRGELPPGSKIFSEFKISVTKPGSKNPRAEEGSE